MYETMKQGFLAKVLEDSRAFSPNLFQKVILWQGLW